MSNTCSEVGALRGIHITVPLKDLADVDGFIQEKDKQEVSCYLIPFDAFHLFLQC